MVDGRRGSKGARFAADAPLLHHVIVGSFRRRDLAGSSASTSLGSSPLFSSKASSFASIRSPLSFDSFEPLYTRYAPTIVKAASWRNSDCQF